MRFRVMDAGHGFCAYLLDSLGGLTVFDCGAKAGMVTPTGHFVGFLRKKAIRQLVITNYDEDHISDLPRLVTTLTINGLRRNPSVTPHGLRRLKIKESGTVTPAMETLCGMMSRYPESYPPDPPGAKLVSYYHDPDKFDGTNNLSLVTFLKCPDKTFLLPGDLERDGWDVFLGMRSFRAALREVNVYIASHHGREDGYHERIFEFCRPEAIVLSDSSIEHETQKGMVSKYRKHLKSPGGDRRVYTTRGDGFIQWKLDGQWRISTRAGARDQP